MRRGVPDRLLVLFEEPGHVSTSLLGGITVRQSGGCCNDWLRTQPVPEREIQSNRPVVRALNLRPPCPEIWGFLGRDRPVLPLRDPNHGDWGRRVHRAGQQFWTEFGDRSLGGEVAVQVERRNADVHEEVAAGDKRTIGTHEKRTDRSDFVPQGGTRSQ